MADFEHKENSFSAFKNKRKESPTHADYTGEGLIGGKKHWINIWVKKDKNGNQYFSGSVRPQGEKTQAKSFTPKEHNEPLEDEIPF